MCTQIMFQELKLKIPGQICPLRLKNSILDPRWKMELKHMYVGSLHLNDSFQIQNMYHFPQINYARLWAELPLCT